MATGKRKTRKWRIAAWGLGGILLLILLLMLAIPLWLPWVLRPIAANYGATYSSYERLGYSRFALRELKYDQGRTHFAAGRVEAFVPTVWLWRHSTGSTNVEPPYLIARDWRLSFSKGARSKPKEKSASTAKLLNTLQPVFGALQEWIPGARLANGTIELPSQKLQIPAFTWNNGRVIATVDSPKWQRQAALQANLAQPFPWSLSATVTSLAVRAELQIAPRQTGWAVEGDLFWRTNQIRLTGYFAGGDWWPERATVTATNFVVAADLLQLPDYEALTGRVLLNWRTNQFDLDVAGRADPRATATNRPPVDLELAAHGSPDAAVVERLAASAPGVDVALSAPLEVSRARPWITGPARLRLALDLASVPWLQATGNLQGLVRMTPDGTNYPTATFELSGTNVLARGWDARRLEVNGDFKWPWLNLETATVQMTNDSSLALEGRLNLQSKSVADGGWTVGGDFLKRYLPAGCSFTNLQGSGEFSGALGDLQQAGKVRLSDLDVPGLKPLQIEAAWSGQMLSLTNFTLDVSAGNSAFSLAGATSISESTNRDISLTLQEFHFEKTNQVLYALRQPAEFHYRRGASSNSTPTFAIRSFDWTGDGRGLSATGAVTWPAQGQFSLHGHGVDLREFADFMESPPPGVTVSNLDLSGIWERGPLRFQLQFQSRVAAKEDQVFLVRADVKGDGKGLEFEPLIVSGNQAPVVSFHGTFPLALVPGSTNSLLQLEPDRPIDLRAHTEPNKVFWERLAGLTGIRLHEPRLELELTGTSANPQGRLAMRADLVEWVRQGTNAALPEMDQLRVDLEIQKDRVQLKNFSVEIADQPVRATAELPLTENFWQQLMSDPALPDWKQATARLMITNAEIAPFARYLPKVLSQDGRLNLNVALQAGGKLQGELRITNAATRPLMPLGPIRDIDARVRFTDRDAIIDSFKGDVGGRPVSIAGGAHLTDDRQITFAVTLNGKNVALVRQPGLLIRANLDVRLTQTNEATVVSGNVKMRDSLFLQDLKALVPGGLAQPSRRPPYFSVDAEPFANWKLDLRIEGTRFLQLKTPLFRGEVSTALQLKGNLEEPVAVGEVRINEGKIRFPFGNLDIDQGFVSLTSENPYHPQLFITASSRNYGYNLKMEVSGTADQPVIAFTSTPPLTSEEIVLMLTAGQLPRHEYDVSTQERAGRLALFFGRDLLSRMGADESLADRFTIRSGENISEQGKLTYYVEFRLTDDWSLVGEYDRFNAMNAGLKWKLYSK